VAPVRQALVVCSATVALREEVRPVNDVSMWVLSLAVTVGG